MTAAAAAVLARIEGAGAAAALDADGRVRIARASRVPPEVVEAARRHRDELARLLAERKRAAFLLRAAEDAAAALAAPDPDLARERAEAEGAGRQRTGGVPLVPGSGRQAGRLRGARALAAAARAGAEALAVPDPDLERERAEIAAALAAEACGGFGPSSAPERHREAVAGLLRGFTGHVRPFRKGRSP